MVRAIGGHVISAIDLDQLNPDARKEALSVVGEMSMPQIVAAMSSGISALENPKSAILKTGGFSAMSKMFCGFKSL